MPQNSTDAIMPSRGTSHAVASAAWHGLFWLVVANAAGAMIAILLLFPALNQLLGEWTYGRWIMVHMNLELYGWTSIPLVGFLFRVYGADRGPNAQWCRPILWAWSAALAVGALSWLSGHSSGKLFLDWSGFALVLFSMTMAALWFLLMLAFIRNWSHSNHRTFASISGKVLGLALLFAVPFLIYIASSPAIYPAVNPDTGGPTGASQLESSLVIVAILLLLPFGLARRKAGWSWQLTLGWSVLAAESVLCGALGRGDISHHRPAQFLSLACLLLWVPLTPAYYACFAWHPAARRWRNVFLGWWSLLLVSGWILFLPGVLDHFKFTDGLVGHSLLAMAGFTSSLLIFVMVQLLGKDGWIFNRSWSFYAWNGSVLAYAALMMLAGWREGFDPAFTIVPACKHHESRIGENAGWREGFDPAFTIVPGLARSAIYLLRIVVGALMLAASLEWLLSASALLGSYTRVSVPMALAKEKTA